jgi:hypothetical protein
MGARGLKQPPGPGLIPAGHLLLTVGHLTPPAAAIDCLSAADCRRSPVAGPPVRYPLVPLCTTAYRTGPVEALPVSTPQETRSHHRRHGVATGDTESPQETRGPATGDTESPQETRSLRTSGAPWRPRRSPALPRARASRRTRGEEPPYSARPPLHAAAARRSFTRAASARVHAGLWDAGPKPVGGGGGDGGRGGGGRGRSRARGCSCTPTLAPARRLSPAVDALIECWSSPSPAPAPQRPGQVTEPRALARGEGGLVGVS